MDAMKGTKNLLEDIRGMLKFGFLDDFAEMLRKESGADCVEIGEIMGLGNRSTVDFTMVAGYKDAFGVTFRGPVWATISRDEFERRYREYEELEDPNWEHMPY